MLKQNIEYVDIDGVRVNRTVMFNLTRFEVEGELELELLQERFQKFQDEVIGDNPEAPIRDMTGPEKREILGMVKDIVRHSYGIKDGKRFIKSEEVWNEFEQTGAFSAFIYFLFEDPSRANAFMAGIWPQGVDRPEDEPSPDLRIVPGELVGEGNSEWDFKGKIEDYSIDELQNMSTAEFDAVVKRFSNGKNVPLALLQVGMQRGKRDSSE